jgi:murein DD-endopeptidase MepM/ murein hydrolase activator NlpD
VPSHGVQAYGQTCRTCWPRGSRELSGPSRIVGNHVVLDLGGGVYALLAHLERGSIRVRPGQRVAAGEQLAECGNSGNSSEPHLHFQLMDSTRVLFAAGLPFRFEGVADEGLAGDAGVPANGKPFVATGTAPSDR